MDWVQVVVSTRKVDEGCDTLGVRVERGTGRDGRSRNS